jgi:hypothetical protein
MHSPTPVLGPIDQAAELVLVTSTTAGAAVDVWEFPVGRQRPRRVSSAIAVGPRPRVTLSETLAPDVRTDACQETLGSFSQSADVIVAL